MDMDIDYGVIIGLILTASAAGMLGLSYMGAFLLGRSRGRREAERGLRATERDAHADRLLAVEGAVDSVARSMARLADAQRLLLIEQERAYERPGAGAVDPRFRIPRAPGSNTPA